VAAKCTLTCCEIIAEALLYTQQNRYGLSCQDINYAGIAKHYVQSMLPECTPIPVNPQSLMPPIPVITVEFTDYVCQTIDELDPDNTDYAIIFSKHVCEEIEDNMLREFGAIYNNKVIEKSRTTIEEGYLYNQHALMGKIGSFDPLHGYGNWYNYYSLLDITSPTVYTERIAPTGFHVLNKTDLLNMIASQGGVLTHSEANHSIYSSGLKFKEATDTRWIPGGCVGGTNLSGFTAVGAGLRDSAGGMGDTGMSGEYWVIDDTNANEPMLLELMCGTNNIMLFNFVAYGADLYNFGLALRFAMDAPETFVPGMTMTDNNGNIYPLVKIGDVVVTSCNAVTTKYNDDSPISFIEDSVSWASNIGGATCYNQNNIDHVFITTLVDKISPAGFHLPNITEWQEIILNAATDYTALNLTQGGIRNENGTFVPTVNKLNAWAFAEENPLNGKSVEITEFLASSTEINPKTTGLAVRLVKDSGDFTEGETFLHDGKEYRLGKFGNKVVMLDNLATVQYSNDSPIANVPLAANWEINTDGAYCAFNNDENRVLGETEFLLAPDGWHVALTSDSPSLVPINLNTAVFNPENLGIRMQTGEFYSYSGGLSIWLRSVFENIDDSRRSIFIEIPSGLSEEQNHFRMGMYVRLVKDNGVLPIGSTVTDIDGNVYDVMSIGGKIWTLQNFRATHYKDGTPIPNITTNLEWSTTDSDGYCTFNNE
jgi:uncharacterized protein (TIGR02145 family)